MALVRANPQEIAVTVSPIYSREALEAGLSTESVRHHVRQHLSGHELRVQVAGERLSDGSVLVVRVVLSEGAAYVGLEFDRRVQLDVQGSTVAVSATVWSDAYWVMSIGSPMGEGEVRDVLALLSAMLDHFVDDYLAANPRDDW